MDQQQQHILKEKTLNMSGHAFADYRNGPRVMAIADKQAKTAWRATVAYVSGSASHAKQAVRDHIKVATLQHCWDTAISCTRHLLSSTPRLQSMANIRLVDASVGADEFKAYDVRSAIDEIDCMLCTWDGFNGSTDMNFLDDWSQMVQPEKHKKE